MAMSMASVSRAASGGSRSASPAGRRPRWSLSLAVIGVVDSPLRSRFKKLAEIVDGRRRDRCKARIHDDWLAEIGPIQEGGPRPCPLAVHTCRDQHLGNVG